MKLSEHFSLWEAVQSQTAARLGLDNTPGPQEVYNLQWTATYLLEPLRAAFGPIRITSGYRSPALNEKVAGSSKTSAHMRGLAFDLIPITVLEGHVALKDVVVWVTRNAILPWDQCILEYNRWVHIGAAHPAGVGVPRRQPLAKFEGSEYVPFDPKDPRIR